MIKKKKALKRNEIENQLMMFLEAGGSITSLPSSHKNEALLFSSGHFAPRQSQQGRFSMRGVSWQDTYLHKRAQPKRKKKPNAR